MSQATEKQMHFGDMSSQINSFKLSFNCIVPYLYSLQIPLIPVYVEAARSRSLSVPLHHASCTGVTPRPRLRARVSHAHQLLLWFVLEPHRTGRG
ncbi:hypothetical protein VIGAN_01162200 [Vigna angularis var. angularis]|uniref:Uncharacterized protein n=1 Tax=Vigna angularis var. angularis TaxID=157739 RepID=A0A0S3R0A4_PHAAN|nr:hypothetical protein VIGAN_01162200 [Vigna angularis var. angularis]